MQFVTVLQTVPGLQQFSGSPPPAGPPGLAHELRDAEIEHLHARHAGHPGGPAGVTGLLREEDVVGLEVAVHDPDGVRGADGRGHLEEDAGGLGDLENLIERLVVLSPGQVVGAAEVNAALAGQVRFVTQTVNPEGDAGADATALETARPSPEAPPAGERGRRLDDAVRDAERAALRKALAQAGGNRTEAARILGVSRRTLYTKLQELGIE